uniref:Uncharacterized protein n=1 Tax=Hippocampus comes TaxID=109280 RepID=A0A3Q2Z6D0_HIPCM
MGKCVKGLLQALKLDTLSSAAVLAGAAACITGTMVVLARAVDGRLDARRKMQKARNLRHDSLLRAEEAVLHYKNAHPKMDPSLILSLSLADLTNKLKDGLLRPEDVFYSYMEKTINENKRLNCCTAILLESFDHLKTLESNKGGLLYGVPVSIKDNIAYKVIARWLISQTADADDHRIQCFKTVLAPKCKLLKQVKKKEHLHIHS